MKELRLIILCIIVITSSSCFPDTYTGLQDHERLMAEAQIAEKAGDYTEAERKLALAVDVARKIQWSEGVITAKRGLSNIYVIQKRYVDADQSFSEAKILCVRISCLGLETIFDQFIFFQLFQAKNPEKAYSLATELLEDPSLLPSPQARRDKAIEYASHMKTAGFPEFSQRIADAYLR